MNIVGKRNWYFTFSLLIIIPGVISLLLWGLNLSIDFTGGSEMTFTYPQKVSGKTVSVVNNSFAQEKLDIISFQQSDNQVTVRTKPLTNNQDETILKDLKKNNTKVVQNQFETIGPVVGSE